MSKFFAGGSSDSELSSSEEEDLYLSHSSSDTESDLSDSDGPDASEQGSEGDDDASDSDSKGPQQFMRNKFLKGQGSDSDDSDSDDDRGAIKSAKDKLIDEINASVRSFEAAAAAGDWVEGAAAFDRTFKVQDKAMRVYSVVPLSVVKMLSGVEGLLSDARASKLTPSNSKAVNVITQRSKKYSKEFSSQLDAYVKDPTNYNPEPPKVSEVAASRASEVPADASGATAATLFTTLESVVEARGKRKTDKNEQIETLEALLKVADSPYATISVLLILIPIRFDVYHGTTTTMPTEAINAIERNIVQLFEVLETNTEFIVVESAREPEDRAVAPAPGPGGARQLPGSISSLVERLDDEHTKALQVINPHSAEYMDRLRHQTQLYRLLLRAQCHLERNLERIGSARAGNESLSRLLVRRLEHVYYKPVGAIISTEVASWKAVPEALDSQITPRISAAPKDAVAYSTGVIDAIAAALTTSANSVFRAKATLAQIYHYALNDQYHKARDLMLVSHLQSTVHNAEPNIQVLFNRALVQMGLCAFRCGLVQDSLQALQEVCSSNRLKELLGQGLAKGAGQADRSQILPFHMHINVELIECVYLTCSLLIEIPLSAAARPSDKKRVVSKPFRRMLDFYDRQVLMGPSENTRDHIIQAAKAVQQGEWQTASDLLCSISVWQLMGSTDKIMAMLRSKLQTEALTTYLLTYCQCYEYLGLEHLSEQFALEVDVVRSQVTKMIAQGELPAVLDETDEFVVFGGEEQGKLQVLGAVLADKTGLLTERNERLADARRRERA